MDIRKAYYMATSHIHGNYNKLSKNPSKNNQSIADFFNALCLQKLYQRANSDEKEIKYDLLDVFLTSAGTLTSLEDLFEFMEVSCIPTSDQIDNFLYPICSNDDLYNLYNNKFGKGQESDISLSRAIFKNKEIYTILDSYIRFCSIDDANASLKLKQILEMLVSSDEDKIIEQFSKMIDKRPKGWYKKNSEKMLFECNEQRLGEYILKEDRYKEKLHTYSEKTKIKVSSEQRKADKLAELNAFKEKTKGIFSHIVGQREQLNLVMHALYRAQLGLNNINGPKASMLLTGPTGVGKTETAYAISESLYGQEPFVVDLSVYNGSHQLSTLIGSPPGYVGYTDKPTLLEYIKNHPKGGVLLFDEFDKANHQVLNIFMHMLDKGEIQSAKGDCYNVKNFIIITTSNITEKINKKIGFGDEKEEIKNIISSNAIGGVPPELIARFDVVTAYTPLTREDKIELARRQMTSICDKIKKVNDFLNVKVKYDDYVLGELADTVNDSMGIRELFRNISSVATKKLVEYIMQNDSFTNIQIYIKSEDNIEVSPLKSTKKPQTQKNYKHIKKIGPQIADDSDDFDIDMCK